MNDMITKIETLEPKPTEAIVIHFNFNDIILEDMISLYHHIESKFPNNSIIALPDKISLQSCSKDVLKNFMSTITEIADAL